jgi:hypothetical protein
MRKEEEIMERFCKWGEEIEEDRFVIAPVLNY